MQLHTNDFTLYRQHIRDGGRTASGFLWAGLRNSTSNLLRTQTNSYGSRGESASLPNYSGGLLYKPCEQKVFDPAQTTAAPFFFSSQAANPHRRLWLSFGWSHVLKPFLYKWASPNDITPPARFLLVWKSLDRIRFVLPEEAGHFPEQVARWQIASSSGGAGGHMGWDATTHWVFIGAEYSSNMYTNWSL